MPAGRRPLRRKNSAWQGGAAGAGSVRRRALAAVAAPVPADGGARVRWGRVRMPSVRLSSVRSPGVQWVEVAPRRVVSRHRLRLLGPFGARAASVRTRRTGSSARRVDQRRPAAGARRAARALARAGGSYAASVHRACAAPGGTRRRGMPAFGGAARARTAGWRQWASGVRADGVRAVALTAPSPPARGNASLPRDARAISRCVSRNARHKTLRCERGAGFRAGRVCDCRSASPGPRSHQRPGTVSSAP